MFGAPASAESRAGEETEASERESEAGMSGVRFFRGFLWGVGVGSGCGGGGFTAGD